MKEFYVRVWDGVILRLFVKMAAPRIPQPGEEVNVDLDHPLTQVEGGTWMEVETLDNRQAIYTIAKPWRADTQLEGLPILDVQLGDQL